MALALTGARIFDGDRFRDGDAVIVDGKRIADVVPAAKLSSSIETIKLDGGVLAPGFIDVQVNGGGGALLNNDATVDGVRRIAESHRRFGTTGMLPTVITDRQGVLDAAIGAVTEARRAGVPGILGIHIEGPFLDPERKGAHPAQFIRPMTEEDVARLAAIDCGAVMLTLAPNKVRPALIRSLADRGVLVSLGHAEATLGEAQSALAAGARAFTHLFNAMSQMNGREPAMVGAALADRDSFIGLIADGHHVHDTALHVALFAKPRDKIMLITDAMPSAAGGPSAFELQGRKVVCADGRLTLEDGTLAGSNLTMDEAVRYCVHCLNLPLADALRMASLNPAAFLRLDHELGRTAPNYLASLVHLGDDLTVKQTWIDGA